MSRAARGPARCSLIPLGTLVAACTATDVVAVSDAPAAFCSRPGPPRLPDGTCTGDLAAAAFGRALTACRDLGLSVALSTDGFDSREGPWTPGGTGGDVAAGSLALDAPADLAGSLTVLGDLEAGPRTTVAGDLAVGGHLGRPGSTVVVAGGARLGGGAEVTALTVGGTLTSAPGTTLAGAIDAGARVTAPVTVAAPAACAAPVVDVGAVVADLAAANHDDAVGLDPDALADVSGARTLELPCGRYYLSRIQGPAATIAIHITGKAVLAVEGGITVSAELTIDVDPGAELDLFVTGPVNLPAATRIGDPSRPWAVRWYIGTGGAVALGPTATLAAGVYAPAADLTADGGDVFGALVVNRLVAAGAVDVHHDRALPGAATACAGSRTLPDGS